MQSVERICLESYVRGYLSLADAHGFVAGVARLRAERSEIPPELWRVRLGGAWVFLV